MYNTAFNLTYYNNKKKLIKSLNLKKQTKLSNVEKHYNYENYKWNKAK